MSQNFADSPLLQCDGAPLWLSPLLHLYVKLSASCWEFNHSNSSQRHTKRLTVGYFPYLWTRNNWIFHVLLHIFLRNNLKMKECHHSANYILYSLYKEELLSQYIGVDINDSNLFNTTQLFLYTCHNHTRYLYNVSITSVVAETLGLLTSPVLMSSRIYIAEIKSSTIFQAYQIIKCLNSPFRSCWKAVSQLKTFSPSTARSYLQVAGQLGVETAL